MWQTVAFNEWRNQCQSRGEPLSSLHYVILLNVTQYASAETKHVFDHLKSSDVFGSSISVGFEPPDPNFFALLGTTAIAMAVNMISSHVESFATRNLAGNSIGKIKSIASIKVWGPPYNHTLLIFDDMKPPIDPALTRPNVIMPVTFPFDATSSATSGKTSDTSSYSTPSSDPITNEITKCCRGSKSKGWMRWQNWCLCLSSHFDEYG